MSQRYAQYQSALRQQTLPAVLVDMELFEANLRALLARSGELPLRLATKSVRCVALLREALAFDARCQGLLCFHASEAARLASLGFDDLVVAYPTVQRQPLREVCEQLRQGRRITLMVDDAAQVAHIATVAQEEQVRIPLCLDVDMSWRLPGLNFGVFRSPVRSVEVALSCFAAIRAQRGVVLEGVMGYEAQIAGLGDATPGQRLRSALIRRLKAGSIPRLQALRSEVVAALRDAGAELRFVNGGGTGSLESTSADASVTEVTAGSGLYAPVLFDHYQAFRHQPAMVFALEVVRRPQPGIATCLGGGYIASGPAGEDRWPTPVWPAGLSLLANEGAGEVQTPVTGPVLPEIGEPVVFRHAKAGELCERFEHLLLWRAGAVQSSTPTYRGEGWHFI